MSSGTEELLKQALDLPAAERAVLAEALLTSLDHPDATAQELWAKEAERRLAAFENGQRQAIPAEDVFAEIKTG